MRTIIARTPRGGNETNGVAPRVAAYELVRRPPSTTARSPWIAPRSVVPRRHVWFLCGETRHPRSVQSWMATAITTAGTTNAVMVQLSLVAVWKEIRFSRATRFRDVGMSDLAECRRKRRSDRHSIRPLVISPATGDLPTGNVRGMPEDRLLNLRAVESLHIPIDPQGCQRLNESSNQTGHGIRPNTFLPAPQ